jgi:hypothetical protein
VKINLELEQVILAMKIQFIELSSQESLIVVGSKKDNASRKRKQMQDLKPETIAMFEKFYIEYPELIDYRIKFGNVYEKAQAISIKSVAESVLQNTAAAKQ